MKNTIKFGVEIEYKDAKASTVQSNLNKKSITNIQEGYHASNNFTVWKVCSDSSVSTGYGRNMRGGELVSPVLTIDNLDQIDAVCDALQKSNATVNRQCGLHVHISWESMNGKTIKKIVDRYKMFEYEMDRFMPPSRQGNENRYCRSLVNIDFSRSPNANYLSDLVGNKFSKVNTSNLTSRTKTIEFRHHSGTINAFKIKNWILFLMDFVAESHKNQESNLREDVVIRTPKLTNKFSEINNRLRLHNRQLQFKNGKWCVVKPSQLVNGEFVVSKICSTSQLRILYDGSGHSRVINQERLAQFIENVCGIEDNLWNGIDEKVSYYFRGRQDLERSA